MVSPNMVPPYQMACAVATDNCCLSSAAHAPDRDRAPSRNRNCVGVGQAGGPMPLEFDPMPCGYSVRGPCRKERRKARWFCNPKGIVSSSPATVLPSPRGYPGLASVRFSTPTGLCPHYAIGPQPRWGWPTSPAFPRVARGSQPGALGRNPFGIHLKVPQGWLKS